MVKHMIMKKVIHYMYEILVLKSEDGKIINYGYFEDYY